MLLFQLHDTLSKSDKMMAVVKDLFGDDPRVCYLGYISLLLSTFYACKINKIRMLISIVNDLQEPAGLLLFDALQIYAVCLFSTELCKPISPGPCNHDCPNFPVTDIAGSIQFEKYLNFTLSLTTYLKHAGLTEYVQKKY